MYPTARYCPGGLWIRPQNDITFSTKSSAYPPDPTVKTTNRPRNMGSGSCPGSTTIPELNPTRASAVRASGFPPGRGGPLEVDRQRQLDRRHTDRLVKQLVDRGLPFQFHSQVRVHALSLCERAPGPLRDTARRREAAYPTVCPGFPLTAGDWSPGQARPSWPRRAGPAPER